MGKGFVFEDGTLYEFRTRIGVVTIVCDTNVVPPLRIYGPDGVELDPHMVEVCESENTHAGFLAYDLTRFEERK